MIPDRAHKKLSIRLTPQMLLQSHKSIELKTAGKRITFPIKLFLLLEHAEPLGLDHILSWCCDGTTFAINNIDKMEKDLVSSYFNCKNIRSFYRQMNYWNFLKIHRGENDVFYCHPGLARGNAAALKTIRRTKNKTDQKSPYSDREYAEPDLALSRETNRVALTCSSSPGRPSGDDNLDLEDVLSGPPVHDRATSIAGLQAAGLIDETVEEAPSSTLLEASASFGHKRFHCVEDTTAPAQTTGLQPTIMNAQRYPMQPHSRFLSPNRGYGQNGNRASEQKFSSSNTLPVWTPQQQLHRVTPLSFLSTPVSILDSFPLGNTKPTTSQSIDYSNDSITAWTAV